MSGYIKTREDLVRFLDKESKYYGANWKKYLPINIGEGQILLKYITLLRKTEYHINTKHKLLAMLYRIRLLRMQNKYLLHIPPNVADEGLHIMHLGPILINNQVKIGKNCAIHINTAIVAGGRGGQVPVLGNDIVIGVGATLVGGISIGDGIAIGANALVNKSFLEENIAIAGVPAKKISNNGRKSWGNKKN